MAGHDTGEYHKGEMDVHDHQATFQLFISMTKWGSLFIAATLVLLVLWFCVPAAGFVPGLIAAVVVAVIGFFLLKAKPDTNH